MGFFYIDRRKFVCFVVVRFGCEGGFYAVVMLLFFIFYDCKIRFLKMVLSFFLWIRTNLLIICLFIKISGFDLVIIDFKCFLYIKCGLF